MEKHISKGRAEGRKLSLHRETLVQLTGDQLRGVAAGTGGGWSGTWGNPNPTCNG